MKSARTRPSAADPPAELYQPSSREYTGTLPPVEYPGNFIVKRVTNAGTIRLKKRLLFIANSSNTPSASRRSPTTSGPFTSATSSWAAWTNGTTSSGRSHVLPMFPVYSVTYLPGCSALGWSSGTANPTMLVSISFPGSPPRGLWSFSSVSFRPALF